MLNRSASLAVSTSVLKTLPGKLDINTKNRNFVIIASVKSETVDKMINRIPGSRLLILFFVLIYAVFFHLDNLLRSRLIHDWLKHEGLLWREHASASVQVQGICD